MRGIASFHAVGIEEGWEPRLQQWIQLERGIGTRTLCWLGAKEEGSLKDFA
jgi:hypothetical protein